LPSPAFRLRRGADAASPFCAAFLFLGCSAAMPPSLVRRDPVVDGSDARAEPFGGLLPPHAAQYQLDRLGPCLQWDDGFRHTAGIPGIRRKPTFQALPGRVARAVAGGVAEYRSTARRRSSGPNI